MQITINPADEQPSTLRAVALLLNSIASDRDGGKIGEVVERTVILQAGQVSKTTTERFDVPNDQTPPPPPPLDAPGASDQSSTGQTGANAPQGSNGAELDVNGLPWDARIHSSSKNKNQDGTWRYTRGGDTAERARVEAELRAGTGSAQSDQTPPPPPPVDQQQQTPPPPPPIETPPAAGGGAPVEMKEVFSRAANLPKDQQLEALTLVGLASMAEFLKEVKTRPEVSGELLAAIVAVTGEE